MLNGRPQLFPQSKQVSVLMSADDYRALVGLVEQARAEHPLYTVGDKLREYIRLGLKADAVSLKLSPLDPGQMRVRQLHALARTAKRIAKELEQAHG